MPTSQPKAAGTEPAAELNASLELSASGLAKEILVDVGPPLAAGSASQSAEEIQAAKRLGTLRSRPLCRNASILMRTSPKTLGEKATPLSKAVWQRMVTDGQEGAPQNIQVAMSVLAEGAWPSLDDCIAADSFLAAVDRAFYDATDIPRDSRASLDGQVEQQLTVASEPLGRCPFAAVNCAARVATCIPASATTPTGRVFDRPRGPCRPQRVLFELLSRRERWKGA